MRVGIGVLDIENGRDLEKGVMQDRVIGLEGPLDLMAALRLPKLMHQTVGLQGEPVPRGPVGKKAADARVPIDQGPETIEGDGFDLCR